MPSQGEKHTLYQSNVYKMYTFFTHKQPKSHTLCSLRSKRFRRVWEQRKTEERGFRYFARAENGARAKQRTVGVWEGKERNRLRTNPWILKTPFAGERGS